MKGSFTSQSPEYSPGLDRIKEAVISSHFMQRLAENPQLNLYRDDEFDERSLFISSDALSEALLPTLLASAARFCSARAASARQRAVANYQLFALHSQGAVGVAEQIAEVFFDRQFVQRVRVERSRVAMAGLVREKLRAGERIQMVIPALPFKIPSPLKNRGTLPDLGEVNFLLSLYEIALTVELLLASAGPAYRSIKCDFTVVSDGSRFNRIVGEEDAVVLRYRRRLEEWIGRLGIGRQVRIVDYTELINSRLSLETREELHHITAAARQQYADTIWPIYDPHDPTCMLRAIADSEPDPESSNTEGRFVPLLRSLAYTIRFGSLAAAQGTESTRDHSLYRALTASLFQPENSRGADRRLQVEHGNGAAAPLRRAMLEEAFTAAINYLAEIKGGRELLADPILTCLPHCFRWTIHAKRGQLALATSACDGVRVQAWAGAAVFKPDGKGRIKLCSLPVLALEGASGTPVRCTEEDGAAALGEQPLFYLDPRLGARGLNEFLTALPNLLVRTRVR